MGKSKEREILIEFNDLPFIDPQIKAKVDEKLKLVDQAFDKPIANTSVFLDGSDGTCRLTECNLGNFISDALVNYYLMKPKVLHKGCDDCWADAPIAVVQGGGIRSSIEEKNAHQVTLEDLITVFPFENTIESVIMTGATLKEMMEWSVNGYDAKYFRQGRFLQHSGIKVTYDLSQPNGQRVADLQVRCARCRVPEYEPVNMTEKYRVLMLSFMLQGGDGYSMLVPENNPDVEHVPLGDRDVDVVEAYFRGHHMPIMQGLEGRISFIGDEEVEPSASEHLRISFTMVLIMSLLPGLIHHVIN